VTVENLGPCKKLLRFDIEAAAVTSAFADIAKEYQKQASLPGFRPGKAPKEMVLKRYEKDIEQEAKRKLMGDSYRDALKEHKIEVVGYPDIEEIQRPWRRRRNLNCRNTAIFRPSAKNAA
jgi:trigger factor